jgi:iron complex outermembrane receptor protein
VGLLRLIPLGPAGGLHLDVALFWNEFEDLIEPKFVRLTNPSRVGFQFINLTEARIRGLDASVEGAWLDDRLTVNLSYTYLNADDLGEEKTLSYRPPHLFKVALDGRPYGPLTAGLDFRYASTPDGVDSDFARFVPDADFLVDTRVLDVRLGVRMSRLRLAFIVKNALDYYYLLRPALLAPPRQFILRFQADF